MWYIQLYLWYNGAYIWYIQIYLWYNGYMWYSVVYG